jgi:hypothetical protein
MKFFSGNRPTASLLVILTAVLLLAPMALYGQATGNVTGVVADTTGAVIPKAAVVLTDIASGIKRTTTSNSDGAFAFAGVTPDLSYQDHGDGSRISSRGSPNRSRCAPAIS